MSVFADDLLILVDDMKIDEVRHTLDEDMKLKWTDTIGPDWTFEVRVPPKYWRGLLEETGLTDA
eukprot:11580147-Heterocapsa_arctica.AAC.1